MDGGEGNKLYGETYADIWAINRLHFQATVAMECDRVSFKVDYRFFFLRTYSKKKSVKSLDLAPD